MKLDAINPQPPVIKMLLYICLIRILVLLLYLIYKKKYFILENECQFANDDAEWTKLDYANYKYALQLGVGPKDFSFISEFSIY